METMTMDTTMRMITGKMHGIDNKEMKGYRYMKRKMNFTFVSTAHWVFDTHGGLKYLTNWGQKTVAVSDDIKDYLKTNYGVPDKNIFVTINGIDTDKFSPECDCSDFEKEFGLKENENRLVYVSRMDEGRAYADRHVLRCRRYFCRIG